MLIWYVNLMGFFLNVKNLFILFLVVIVGKNYIINLLKVFEL